MESSRAKYKLGTRVKYKLDNPNFNVQYGIITASYYSSYSNKVYYTISKDDGTTAEVPEELLVVINDRPNVIINDNEEDYGDEG